MSEKNNERYLELISEYVKDLKYGNIVLKGRNEFFTLYKTSKNNGYLWRRTNDCSQIYPLNMKRKNIEK